MSTSFISIKGIVNKFQLLQKLRQNVFVEIHFKDLKNKTVLATRHIFYNYKSRVVKLFHHANECIQR